MSTEKVRGGRIPDWITDMWVLEDRMIAEGMAAMRKDEEAGKFPKFTPDINTPNIGVVMIFGTGGELNHGSMSFEELFNKSEGYNLKQ